MSWAERIKAANINFGSYDLEVVLDMTVVENVPLKLHNKKNSLTDGYEEQIKCITQLRCFGSY